MNTMNKWLTVLVIIAVTIAVITGYSVNDKINQSNNKIDSLIISNKKLEELNDSLTILLKREEIRYDSLKMQIDSSEFRYNELDNKYQVIRDSVRYLNADESILFLIREAGL